MPKQKTNSGAKKRFSFTATGKIKRLDEEDQKAKTQLGSCCYR